MPAGVAGVIIGATAGGADIEAGVWRDLVATGRGRIALFAARVPGALALVLPILAVALAVPALVSAVLSDGAPLSPAAGGRRRAAGARLRRVDRRVASGSPRCSAPAAWSWASRSPSSSASSRSCAVDASATPPRDPAGRHRRLGGAGRRAGRRRGGGDPPGLGGGGAGRRRLARPHAGDLESGACGQAAAATRRPAPARRSRSPPSWRQGWRSRSATPFALVALSRSTGSPRNAGARAAAPARGAGRRPRRPRPLWESELRCRRCSSRSRWRRRRRVRRRRRRRRAAAARERELLAERAATEERLRIARELHDAVGHDVSLMVVQAQRSAPSRGPGGARGTEAIAALGPADDGRDAPHAAGAARGTPAAPRARLDGARRRAGGRTGGGRDVTSRSRAPRARLRPRSTPPRTGSSRRRSRTSPPRRGARPPRSPSATAPAALELEITRRRDARGALVAGHARPRPGRDARARRHVRRDARGRPGAKERGFAVRAVLPYGAAP